MRVIGVEGPEAPGWYYPPRLDGVLIFIPEIAPVVAAVSDYVERRRSKSGDLLF